MEVSQETRERLSEAQRKNWANPAYRFQMTKTFQRTNGKSQTGERNHQLGTTHPGQGGKVGWMRAGYEPLRKASELEIAWSAGIYEGEGSVQKSHSPNGYGQHIRIGQKDAWILHKLQELWGGRVRQHKAGHWCWGVSGQNARWFVFVIFEWLSPRRQGQIRTAFWGKE